MGVTHRNIVADTSFLVAVHNPTDAHHEAARQLLVTLDTEEYRLVINTHVFGETVTVLSRYLEREQAVLVGILLQSDPQVLLVPSSPDFERRTWEIFMDISKKRTSYADCSVVATVEYAGAPELLTFDMSDFEPLEKKYRFRIVKPPVTTEA